MKIFFLIEESNSSSSEINVFKDIFNFKHKLEKTIKNTIFLQYEKN